MALVLIADDSPTDQHVLVRALEKHGFETLIAKDGQEAIRLAGLHSPDVILMDIVMPGMNGYQATRRLAQDPATASIPILMRPKSFCRWHRRPMAKLPSRPGKHWASLPDAVMSIWPKPRKTKKSAFGISRRSRARLSRRRPGPASSLKRSATMRAIPTCMN